MEVVLSASICFSVSAQKRGFLYFAMYACQICDNRHFVLKGRTVDNQ